MRVDCALICDAVTVRENLLHILGGGITRIHRPAYPAPFGSCMALRIMVHPSEADRPHELTVRLADADGHEMARVVAQFQTNPAVAGDFQPGEEFALPLPLQMQPIGLPHEGAYVFDLLIDGIHQLAIPFVADSNMTGTAPPPAPRPPTRGKK